MVAAAFQSDEVAEATDESRREATRAIHGEIQIGQRTESLESLRDDLDPIVVGLQHSEIHQLHHFVRQRNNILILRDIKIPQIVHLPDLLWNPSQSIR